MTSPSVCLSPAAPLDLHPAEGAPVMVTLLVMMQQFTGMGGAYLLDLPRRQTAISCIFTRPSRNKIMHTVQM